jgi:hypothetical protein
MRRNHVRRKEEAVIPNIQEKRNKSGTLYTRMMRNICLRDSDPRGRGKWGECQERKVDSTSSAHPSTKVSLSVSLIRTARLKLTQNYVYTLGTEGSEQFREIRSDCGT